MFVHICFTMTYTYIHDACNHRANSHTNIVCCRCKSNLKRPLFNSQSSVSCYKHFTIEG